MGNSCVQVNRGDDPNSPRKENNYFSKSNKKNTRVAPIQNFMDLSAMQNEAAEEAGQQKDTLGETLESNTSMRSQDLKSLLNQDELTSLKTPPIKPTPAVPEDRERIPTRSKESSPLTNLNTANSTFKKRSLVIASHLSNPSHANNNSRFVDQTHNFMDPSKNKPQQETDDFGEPSRFELKNSLAKGGLKEKNNSDYSNNGLGLNEAALPRNNSSGENQKEPNNNMPRFRANLDMMKSKNTNASHEPQGENLNNNHLHRVNGVKDEEHADGELLEKLSLDNNNSPSSPNSSQKKSPKSHDPDNQDEEDILFKSTDPNAGGQMQPTNKNNKQKQQSDDKNNNMGDPDIKYNINLQNNATEEELRYLSSYRLDVKGTQIPSASANGNNDVTSPTPAKDTFSPSNPQFEINEEEAALSKSASDKKNNSNPNQFEMQDKRRTTRPIVENINSERKRSVGNTITIAFSEKADKIRRIKEWIDDTILDDLSLSPLEPLAAFSHLEIHRTAREAMKEAMQQPS